MKAGMHEVIVAPETLAAVEAAKAAGRCLWRVSSTVFGHIASDELLQPLGGFLTDDCEAQYPATTAGQQVKRELEVIKLKRKSLPGGLQPPDLNQ